MTKITPNDVLKVAKLSRLELASSEVELFTSQLEKILGYVSQLEQVDTADVEPTTRAVEVVNVLRDDDVESTNIREDLLELGPDIEGEFYKVPKILAE